MFSFQKGPNDHFIVKKAVFPYFRHVLSLCLLLIGIMYYIQNPIELQSQQDMYDILDDNINLTNLSISPGSRSASMKKIPKKQNRPSAFQQSKITYTQNKGFDDLINGFLDKQSKFNGQNSDNLSRTTSKKGNFDSLDFNFDEIGKYKSTSPINSSAVNSFGRPSTAKNTSDVGGQQDHLLGNHFGRTQQTIMNPSKIEDSFVSTRQMKPPIKRRENVSYMSGNIFASEIGMTIPEEDPTVTNSSNDFANTKPARSVNRRSSIDARSQINIDDSFTLKNEPINNSVSFKRQDRVKEEPLEKLSNTESHIIGWGHNDTGFKFGSNFAKNELNSVTHKQKQTKQQNTLQSAVTEAEINERINKSNKAIISDYERQIELMRANYQKQTQFLQESLDKQIAENRELRERFLKETGQMIDEQRSRAKRMHEEEVSRLKDMFQWQKKKITDTLRSQIDSLKSVIDFKKESNSIKTASIHEKMELQNKETKLKLWESSLQEKARMLERRQNDLQQAINQLNSQKRQQEERIRRQQRRLMEIDMNNKRQLMTQKKQLSEQKQRMSVEIGNLELDIIKRKEANQIIARQNEIERQSIEKEREGLRRMNYEVMQAHKQNIQEIQSQRQKISHIELELLKKLRVVEMKAQQAHYGRNNEEDILPVSYELAKMHQKERHQPIRRMSKEANAKSMSNLMKTKERFYEVENNAKSKLNTSIKEHKKLDLGHYMSRIEHFSKAKQ